MWHGGFFNLSYMCFKEIGATPKIRAFPCRTLSQTLDLEIFPRQVDGGQVLSTYSSTDDVRSRFVDRNLLIVVKIISFIFRITSNDSLNLYVMMEGCFSLTKLAVRIQLQRGMDHGNRYNSLVHPHHPPYGSLTVPFSMPHLVSGISFRLLSDNLGPTTLSLTHLFLHPPPHPPLLTHHCHHPSLRRCFTPGSKPSCSTNHFHPRLPSLLFRTDSMVSCPAPFLLSIDR